jgi:L-rhamnose mutarotase
MSRAAVSNPDVLAWEELMWRFQAPTPWTEPGNKWQPMTQVFSLVDQPG